MRCFRIQGTDDYHQTLETLEIDSDIDIESVTSNELDGEIDHVTKKLELFG